VAVHAEARRNVDLAGHLASRPQSSVCDRLLDLVGNAPPQRYSLDCGRFIAAAAPAAIADVDCACHFPVTE